MEPGLIAALALAQLLPLVVQFAHPLRLGPVRLGDPPVLVFDLGHGLLLLGFLRAARIELAQEGLEPLGLGAVALVGAFELRIDVGNADIESLEFRLGLGARVHGLERLRPRRLDVGLRLGQGLRRGVILGLLGLARRPLGAERLVKSPDLGGGLAQLPFDGPGPFEEGLVFAPGLILLLLREGDLLAKQRDRALGLLHLGVQRIHALAPRRQGPLEVDAAHPQLLTPRLERARLGRRLLEGVLGRGELLAQCGGVPRQVHVLEPGRADLEVAQRFGEFPVADGRVDLPLEPAHLMLHLGHDVAQAQDVLAGALETAQGGALTGLVFDDSGRFLEDVAPILRPRAQHHGYLALADERVGARADARVHEQLLDVA